MKTKILISILIINLLFSCKNIVDVTETEVNAVQNVLNFYNGKCLRSKGVELNNGIKIRNFELEMSESELLEHNPTNLQSHSGNIAYLFYSNLNNEKSNYDEIKVKINLKNGESQEFKYSSKELTEIENQQKNVNRINQLILNKDYGKLVSEFDSSIKIDKKNIEELFNLLESKYGKISKTQLQGFEFAESTNYGKIIKIREALMLEKINPTMYIIFSRENKKLISIELP